MVPTGSVHSVKLKRKYTNQDKCDLDIKTCQNLIGEIVNLSQELNTKFWDGYNGGADFEDVKKYYLDSALLDVLSNVEIDRAKREFNIDSKFELKRIREKYNEHDSKGRAIKPKFFGHVARQKGYYNAQKKNYKSHDTTMDHLQKCFIGIKHEKTNGKYLPFSSIVTAGSNHTRIDYDEVQRVIDHVVDTKKSIRYIWALPNELLSKTEKYVTVSTMQQDCINYIDNIRLTKSTMRYLLLQIERPENLGLQRTMLYSLFGAPNKSFYDLVVASATPIRMLVPDEENGEICVYGARYALKNW